jgi:hypothetical protein
MPSAPTRHLQAPPDLETDPRGQGTDHIVGTCDHALIRGWADHHGAEPATGEATPSGPATVNVNDQGTGLRFNFPAAARFRPVEWDEWLAHFDQARFVFVYESGQLDSAAQVRFGGAFYRLVRAADWGDRPLATCSR